MPLALGVVGLVVVALAVVTWFFSTAREAGPPPPDLFRELALPVGVPLALLGVGLYPWLRPKHFVEIDAGAGTAKFVERGVVTRQIPLVQIVPLEHAIEQRHVRYGKTASIATFHVARSRPVPEIRFFESENEMETRRALEARAKAWNVPYVKPSGKVRSQEDLDVPLVQRLRKDEGARPPLLQRPDSKLTVAWKDDGYEITTSYWPKTDRFTLVAMFAIPVLLLWWFLRNVLRGWIAEGFGTPYPWLAGAVVLLALLPGAFVGAKAWLRSNRPPSIRVSSTGVRFRGRSLPLGTIEEIEREGGGAPRLVSDARLVQIDADFCEVSEYDWLLDEIRRLVVEVSQGPAVS